MSDAPQGRPFTEHARHALLLAQEEARRLNHHAIGPEHLLLGLLRDANCAAAQALVSQRITYANTRPIVETLAPRQERFFGDVGLNEDARQVITDAVAAANLAAQPHIGTEHLLLGLLQRDSSATRALTKMGADLTALRARALASHPPNPHFSAILPDAACGSILRKNTSCRHSECMLYLLYIH
ncbi:MAG: hypothetical protein IVW57_18750, partial [Ktedonobacterales bacterium]|nr:hypothetical protein [Ktedonobacterales bacterium]